MKTAYIPLSKSDQQEIVSMMATPAFGNLISVVMGEMDFHMAEAATHAMAMGQFPNKEHCFKYSLAEANRRKAFLSVANQLIQTAQNPSAEFFTVKIEPTTDIGSIPE